MRCVLTGVVSLALAASSFAGGTAFAQVVSASATAKPRFATFPTTRTLEFRLRLVTGVNPASAGVALLKPRFGHGRIGTPLDLRSPTLDGPGSLRMLPSVVEAPLPRVCYRGYPEVPEEASVEIPASSTTTLVVPARLSSTTPPWADTSLQLGFRVFQQGRKPITVRSLGPVRRGPVGVRITLRARARWHEDIPSLPPTVRQGLPITLSGGTRPRLRQRPITLRYYGPGSDRQRALRRVRTDGSGRFSFTWTPPRRGYYGVRAVFRPPIRGSLARDTSCAQPFQVVR
jgi:hypothetical protein